MLIMGQTRLRILLGLSTNIGWFGCVYFGRNGWDMASLIFPLLSWILLYYCFKPSRFIYIILLSMLTVGLIFDSTAAGLSLIHFPLPPLFGWIPLWLVSLWLLFTSSLPLLETVFKQRYFIAAVFGAVLGPLSYQAGAGFGTLSMSGLLSNLIYAMFWGTYLPVSVYWLGRKEFRNENT